MKKIFIIIAVLLVFGQGAFAALNVVVSYPYIKDITEKIGGNRVSVTAFGRGDIDPHYIVPRPSFISKARNADLLIINGAQLEIGWMPPVINQANNTKIVPGEKGFLDLSSRVRLMEIPASVSRSMGDVHPQGNPHFILDPENVPLVAFAITESLATLDPSGSDYYRKNSEIFIARWKNSTRIWSEKMKPLKGSRVIQYHKLYDYFLYRYGFESAGTLELLPGIPPSSRHIEETIGVIKRDSRIKFIMQDVYHPKDTARYVSGKTGVKAVVIPNDVGSVYEAKDIFSLFDEIVRRMTE